MPDRPSRARSALRALEEARFGSQRTLNLRATLPTPQEAATRAEQWLRTQQAHQGGEVLIITGRGIHSIGGVSVVRAAIVKLFSRLKRMGVITSVGENTPGSFVVELAPMRSLLEAPRRHRGRQDAPPDSAALPGLDHETHELLKSIANHSLNRLGVRDTDQFLADEMRRQFTLIARDLPEGPRREDHLRAALLRTLAEYDEA